MLSETTYQKGKWRLRKKWWGQQAKNSPLIIKLDTLIECKDLLDWSNVSFSCFCFILFCFVFLLIFQADTSLVFVSFNCWNFNFTYFSHNDDIISMFRDVPGCSGMFRDVPSSWFYRRPFRYGFCRKLGNVLFSSSFYTTVVIDGLHESYLLLKNKSFISILSDSQRRCLIWVKFFGKFESQLNVTNPFPVLW